MPRRYLQLDVFADRPGAGNPLGVVLDGDGLDDAAMQALAAWLNLSETVFFQPSPEGAGYSVRIFTPKGELPFAGHPSVGSGWAALAHGLAVARDGRLVQHCGAGLLPVRIEGDGAARRVHVRSPRGEPRAAAFPLDTLPALARLLDPALPPQLWNNGPDWWIVALRSEHELRRYHPELEAIAALSGKGKLAAFAPAAHGEAGYRYVVRAFAPGVGIAEDPVTGSANALVAARLLQAGLVGPGTGYVASQGRELGRDGRVEVRVDDDGEVWIGGRVQPVIEGRIDWPANAPSLHRSPA